MKSDDVNFALVMLAWFAFAFALPWGVMALRRRRKAPRTGFDVIT